MVAVVGDDWVGNPNVDDWWVEKERGNEGKARVRGTKDKCTT